MPSSPPLPPLSAPDTTLLLRLFALSENYQSLAAELASGALDHLREPSPSPSLLSPLSSPIPRHLLDLYAWASRPEIAPWIAFHRSMSDNQRRTLALNTLESVIKSTESPTERRRAASTLLRALDGLWSRSRSSIQNPQSKIQNGRRSYAPPPAAVSRPLPNSDPHAEFALVKAAFATPQPSVALSTLHEHAATNAFFAAHPIHADKAEWVATAPDSFPAGFRFPLILTDCKEVERTPVHSRWTTWARNTAGDHFRCNLSLIRDGPDTPNPSWRLASFEILRRGG